MMIVTITSVRVMPLRLCSRYQTVLILGFGSAVMRTRENRETPGSFLNCPRFSSAVHDAEERVTT